MSVLDLAFKRMAMLSTLQEKFNQQNATFFGNNKSVLGVLQSGRGGLPRGRGGLMQKGGAHLPGKVTKYKKFVQEEIADVKKNEPKPIEEEGEEEEEDGSQIQNDNFLEGEVSSPFAKAASSSEEEIEPSKIAPEKQEKKQGRRSKIENKLRFLNMLNNIICSARLTPSPYQDAPRRYFA